MKKNSFQFKIVIILAIFLFLAVFNISQASFNEQINFQGKLTDTSNLAVADDDYNMEFKLYATSSGGVALWTETATATKISVTSGLFSHLLGSISSLSDVDFNQTLWLGVNIGGTSTEPVWDGEMEPRKKLGAVPAAFEAKKLGGKLESAFATLAENETVTGAWDFNNILTVASSTASTTLTVTQSGNGNIIDLKNATSSVFTVASDGTITATGNMIISGTATTTNLVVTTDSKLGTVSGGIWEGTPIGILYGGTGTTTAAGARTNLGLAIGTDVQAYNAGLQSISGLTTGANQMIYLTGSNTYSTTTLTAFARTILDDGDAGTLRTTIELGNVENTALSTWAGSTNITTLGTIATGTWQGVTIAPGFGGTGLTSYSEGDIIYATATATLSKLNIGATNTVLTSSGSAPQWSTSLNLAGTLEVTGTTTIGSFVMAAGASSTYVLTSDANGIGTWKEATGGGGDVGGSGAANYIARWTDATTLATSTIFEDSGKIGIGTTTPAYTLDVYGTFRAVSTSTFSGYVGIGTTSPAYILDVINPTATTTVRFGTSENDEVLIGGGTGKLTAGLIDPPYTIVGQGLYATYAPSMTGVQEETTGIIKLSQLNEYDYYYSYIIDFNNLEKDSNLWLFYRITDFGENWQNLAVLLSAEGQGQVWHEKDPVQNQLIIYGESPVSVSFRLTSPRFDWKKHLNVRTNGEIAGMLIKEVINDQYTEAEDDGEIKEKNDKDKSLFDKFVSKVKEALGSLGMFVEDGIARLREVITDKITTKKLCVEDVCVTKTELQSLLENAGINQPVSQPPEELNDPPLTDGDNELVIEEESNEKDEPDETDETMAEEESGNQVPEELTDKEESVIEDEQAIEQEQAIDEEQIIEGFEIEETAEEPE